MYRGAAVGMLQGDRIAQQAETLASTQSLYHKLVHPSSQDYTETDESLSSTDISG